MENTEIEKIVKTYILEDLLHGQDITLANDTPLITGRILDSITFLRMAVFLEERFNINVEPHEITVENLNTIDMIIDFVRARL